MKKEYIHPIMKIGMAIESSLLVSSLKGDGLNMDINNENASGAAEGRENSFWDEKE